MLSILLAFWIGRIWVISKKQAAVNLGIYGDHKTALLQIIAFMYSWNSILIFEYIQHYSILYRWPDFVWVRCVSLHRWWSANQITWLGRSPLWYITCSVYLRLCTCHYLHGKFPTNHPHHSTCCYFDVDNMFSMVSFYWLCIKMLSLMMFIDVIYVKFISSHSVYLLVIFNLERLC